MKKVLILLLVLTIVGCSSKEKVETTSTPDQVETQSNDSISANEGLFDVTVHLPASMFDGLSNEQIESGAKENGISSVVINDDGSVDYTMTKSVHNKLMKEMKDNLIVSIEGLLENKEEYPNFEKITYNDDFSEFTVTCTTSELNMSEKMSPLMLAISGAMYQSMNATPNEENRVVITYIDKNSGDIFKTYDTDNLGN